MPVKKGFESFTEVIDNFVKSEIDRHTDAVITRTLMFGQNPNVYRNTPIMDGNELSSIRDPNDGVMFFMVGFDRVNGPSKVGV